ncbi:MAG: glycosyltransferase, partial [Nevskiales bacterium]
MPENRFIRPDARRRLCIALVTETYPPEVNGVAMTLGRFVEGLIRRGHSVQLVRPRQHAADIAAEGCAFSEILVRGVAVPRYAGLQLGLPARAALMRAWTLRRPDIVHVATEGPLGWSAVTAARALQLPVSSGFHTN